MMADGFAWLAAANRTAHRREKRSNYNPTGMHIERRSPRNLVLRSFHGLPEVVRHVGAHARLHCLLAELEGSKLRGGLLKARSVEQKGRKQALQMPHIVT
jgi:hypothetical protein